MSEENKKQDCIIKEYKNGELVREYSGEDFSLTVNSNQTDKPYKSKKFEWMRNYWRPMMACLYFVICALEYVIRPIINARYARGFDVSNVVSQLKGLDAATQMKILEIASRAEFWPATMTPEVHYTFLVILGVAAWTRGKEKEKLAEKGIH